MPHEMVDQGELRAPVVGKAAEMRDDEGDVRILASPAARRSRLRRSGRTERAREGARHFADLAADPRVIARHEARCRRNCGGISATGETPPGQFQLCPGSLKSLLLAVADLRRTVDARRQPPAARLMDVERHGVLHSDGKDVGMPMGVRLERPAEPSLVHPSRDGFAAIWSHRACSDELTVRPGEAYRECACRKGRNETIPGIVHASPGVALAGS